MCAVNLPQHLAPEAKESASGHRGESRLRHVRRLSILGLLAVNKWQRQGIHIERLRGAEVACLRRRYFRLTEPQFAVARQNPTPQIEGPVSHPVNVSVDRPWRTRARSGHHLLFVRRQFVSI
jgi:hypothetical protein